MKQPYPGWPAAQRPAPLAIFRAGRRLAAAWLLALGLAPVPGRAQGPAARPGPGFFQPDAAARTAAAASSSAALLAHVQTQALTLDEPGLRAALATAPLEGRAGAAPLVLALPQPDGTTGRFALREAPVMAPALAARYPQIKTYAGIGLDDATTTVRLDLTPAGFHAQVLSSTGAGFLIDPVSSTDLRHCLSYYQKDERLAAGKAGSCGFKVTPVEEQASGARVAAWRAGAGGGGGTQARSTGAQLRVYRLALTCTPEYALSKGNTTASVLAALVATLNRVVGIMERELTVRLVLVANNDQLLFLSGTGPQPVPALTDSNKFLLIDENQANTDRVIGEANYDLGHLINSSSGGVAGVGVLCGPRKARGVSGDNAKTIAHEIGHQLGALHTFNSSSTSNGPDSSPWEPGSGVTLMSYGGFLGPTNDVQPYREALYHTGSYEAMQVEMDAQGCGTSVATGNSPPVITAPASGKTLPVGTPFQLTATATDADNDPLTYSWEQLDVGSIGGDLNMPQVTGQTPPLFRTRPPVATPTRYFPRLDELVNNTAPLGERLPTVARGLTFRCTARDTHNGALGVVGGVGLSALVTLDVSAAAGPFVVSAPNAASTSWAGGSTQTVTWDVANTNTAPVSCAKVNLRLSLDGGLTYPLLLAGNVANSGTASVTVPNVASPTARVLVEAADNYFFDLSNANFTITPGPGPVVSSFTPARGPVGTVVTLTGTNFSGATAVRFNGTAAASFTVVSATSITATVGVGSTPGLLSVSTPQGTATSVTPFLVGNPPTITSFTPTSGAPSTSVRITGTNFGGTTQVTLNGTNVEFFFLNSATQLTVLPSSNATTGSFIVTTPFGTATSSPFTVPLLPVIDGFTPRQGLAGTVVVLTGRNFTGATQVRFGGVAAPAFTVNSATQLTATVPVGAITGPISVTAPLGTGASETFFTVLLPPVFTAMSPTSGPAGITLTLTGTALDRVTALTLNGVAVPGFVLVNATTITFVVPAGASTGPVVAATMVVGTNANAGTFTVLPPAAGVLIGGIVPASAITGGTIRLTGTGLSGATRVSFTGSGTNTVSSGFTANAAGTELSGLVVPAGAVTGPLTVTIPAGTSAVSSAVFTLCARPVALAQNTRLVLGTGGTATLAPTAVNNASNANCGVAAASTLRVVPNTFTTADIGPVVVARALRLNGNGQYVAVGGSATMPSGNNPYTIEAWIKPNSMGANGILGWGDFGGYSACNVLRLTATGLINYWWSNDLQAPTPSLVGAWHHVAATYDGTIRTLYLDGVAIGSDQPGTHGVPEARNLRIGSANSGEYFDGLIDEVRVWNVARTTAQLSDNRGIHLVRTPVGLVAYYRFGEGSGTATADANGVAANAGTLTGGASWGTDAPAIVNGVPVTLTVTDDSKYTSTAPAVVTVLPATATATAAGANATAFSVWPNPVGAKGLLHVSLPVPASAARVSLRNALGQLVRTRTFGGSATELSTAGLASGLYLLSVQADGHAPTVRRVVVE